MRTSIRPTEYILGSLRLNERDIEPKAWLEVVSEAMKICGPYLKYCPGFRPIKESMNDWQVPRVTDASVVEFFEDFDGDSLCSHTAQLSYETEGSVEPAGYGVRFVTEQNLLLFRKGWFVLWSARYERERRSRNRSNAWDDYEMVEKAHFSRFSPISGDQILPFLTQSPRLGRQIILTLCNVVTGKVKERERMLEKDREIQGFLLGLSERTSGRLL